MMKDRIKPSEVFLELWQWRALDMTPAEFAEAAGAWRRIVNLEEIYAEAEARQRLLAGGSPLAARRSDEGIAPYAGTDGRSEVDTNGQEGTGGDRDGQEDSGDPSPAAQDDGPRAVTYDCASAPMTEEAAKAAAKSAAGVSSLATRKRRALERLEAVRERGISMADVVAAGPGLTLNDVLDALDRKPLPLPKLAALDKALARIEGGDQSAPPPGSADGR